MSMRRKNRSYKKGGRHRDARLFVIVAEGERKDAYFRYFFEYFSQHPSRQKKGFKKQQYRLTKIKLLFSKIPENK